MLNLNSVNDRVLEANEQGLLFAVLVVRNLKSGGRFVSVRSQSPASFVTGLNSNAHAPSFGAYHSPILTSIRKDGIDQHQISLAGMYKTRLEANAAKRAMVESQAVNRPQINLNWNRPVKSLPETEFRWLSDEEIAEREAAMKARKSASAS